MFPSGLVSDPMVVPAERHQVLVAGRSVLVPGDAMVEVTGSGGHPTSGEDTGRVAALDMAALIRVGATTGAAVMDRLAAVAVGAGPSPLDLVLLFCDLAGDVGDDWPKPGQLPRIFREACQGFEVDMDMHDTPAVPGSISIVSGRSRKHSA